MPSSNVGGFLIAFSSHDLTSPTTGFQVLSIAERTATLYDLSQHSTQVQIRFFIAVLQQMARADPMATLLSLAVGGSMQSQTEAKLASMNVQSPGLKSKMPSSPSACTFSTQNTNAQTASSSFLFPDSANFVGNLNDTAATLSPTARQTQSSQQRRSLYTGSDSLSSAGECSA